MGFTERLSKLDAHSSVSKEFRVYTVQGAVLSVLTCVAIAYFVTTEVAYNFQLTLQERVHVNATSPTGLEMEFDISLPEVPCSSLNIDANDPNGQTQSLHLDGEHHVWKHRMKMKEDGTRMLFGDRTKLELGSTLLDEKSLLAQLNETEEESQDPGCGSCYGAGEEGECCDTCDDVKRAYKNKGWVLSSVSEIKQCNREGQRDEDSDEGCNVHGVVALSTGGGNLHLAPGQDLTSQTSLSVLDVLLQMFQQWNVSHTIHKIRFGPDYPAAVNQLDGETRTIKDTYGMYQYYFQVVPTKYKFRNGTEIQTNQYSVTEHLRHVNPGSNRGMPGVFFFYEVSPLHVEIVEGYSKGWVAFFTSLCAIIGGVVTVMGLVDQYLFTSKHQERELTR